MTSQNGAPILALRTIQIRKINPRNRDVTNFPTSNRRSILYMYIKIPEGDTIATAKENQWEHRMTKKSIRVSIGLGGVRPSPTKEPTKLPLNIVAKWILAFNNVPRKRYLKRCSLTSSWRKPKQRGTDRHWCESIVPPLEDNRTQDSHCREGQEEPKNANSKPQHEARDKQTRWTESTETMNFPPKLSWLMSSGSTELLPVASTDRRRIYRSTRSPTKI
jgi:hypothetical protein